MKLYHGTAARHLPKVLKHGLKPRGKGKGNWEHTVMSRPDAVYLTVAYSLYYALTATKKSEREAVIFEVDSSKLNPFRLCPDEDFLAQAAQVGAPAFKDIKEQYDNDLLKMTAHFRDELEEYSDDWEASVKHMGNCCFIGNIPVEAITRYALIPNIYKFVQWSDPTIGIMNYRVLGEYYQALSKRVFGDETDYVSEYGFYKLPDTRRDRRCSGDRVAECS